MSSYKKKDKGKSTQVGDIEAVQSSKIAMIEKEFERIDTDLRRAQDWFKALWAFDKENERILPYLTEFEGVLRSIFIFHHEFIYNEGKIHKTITNAFNECEKLRKECHKHPIGELPNIMKHIPEPKQWWKKLMAIYDELHRIHSKAIGIMTVMKTEGNKAKITTTEGWESTPNKIYDKPEEIKKEEER